MCVALVLVDLQPLIGFDSEPLSAYVALVLVARLKNVI